MGGGGGGGGRGKKKKRGAWGWALSQVVGRTWWSFMGEREGEREREMFILKDGSSTSSTREEIDRQGTQT